MDSARTYTGTMNTVVAFFKSSESGLVCTSDLSPNPADRITSKVN